MMATGFTTLFWIVGRVGTSELAAANVLLNITLVGFLPCLGLGLAAASLVGQSLGRGDPSDAQAWGWDVAKVGAAVVVVIGRPMVLVPGFLLGLFLENPDTIAMAVLPLRISGSTLVLDSLGLILLNSLIGAGATRTVMVVSVGCQWFTGLIGAYIVGIYAVVWKRGAWKNITPRPATDPPAPCGCGPTEPGTYSKVARM